MSHDAEVVGTISQGNYRDIFFGDNNQHTQESGVAGNQEIVQSSKNCW